MIRHEGFQDTDVADLYFSVETSIRNILQALFEENCGAVWEAKTLSTIVQAPPGC